MSLSLYLIRITSPCGYNRNINEINFTRILQHDACLYFHQPYIFSFQKNIHTPMLTLIRLLTHSNVSLYVRLHSGFTTLYFPNIFLVARSWKQVLR